MRKKLICIKIFSSHFISLRDDLSSVLYEISCDFSESIPKKFHLKISNEILEIRKVRRKKSNVGINFETLKEFISSFITATLPVCGKQ